MLAATKARAPPLATLPGATAMTVQELFENVVPPEGIRAIPTERVDVTGTVVGQSAPGADSGRGAGHRRPGVAGGVVPPEGRRRVPRESIDVLRPIVGQGSPSANSGRSSGPVLPSVVCSSVPPESRRAVPMEGIDVTATHRRPEHPQRQRRPKSAVLFCQMLFANSVPPESRRAVPVERIDESGVAVSQGTSRTHIG